MNSVPTDLDGINQSLLITCMAQKTHADQAAGTKKEMWIQRTEHSVLEHHSRTAHEPISYTYKSFVDGTIFHKTDKVYLSIIICLI